MGTRGVTVAGAGIVAVAVATAGLRALGVHNPTTAALAFVLVVLFAAAAGPLWAAVATSFAAVVSFNLFFLPPVGTWHVADPQNWIALSALLVTSIVASQLSARARAMADERRIAAIARERAELSSALLASMGHDLRTPLTALRVAVENLADQALSAEARAAQAALAAAQARQLTRIFDQILDIARIESKSVRADRVWSTPGEIVDAALASAQSSLAGHPVVVRVDEGEVNLDPRLTASALAHLIENAARYSPDASPITIDASASAEGLRAAVEDEGPGLDAGDLAHLFTPMFRGRAGREAGAGTGMGLAIARGLLAAESGRVWAENREGRGARFSITVPAPVRRSPRHE